MIKGNFSADEPRRLSSTPDSRSTNRTWPRKQIKDSSYNFLEVQNDRWDERAGSKRRLWNSAGRRNPSEHECIPVGCVPSAAVAVSGGKSTQGCLLGGARGVCSGEVSAQRAISCTGGVHPPVDRMTDACEDITFLQLLLRKVMKRHLVNPRMLGSNFRQHLLLRVKWSYSVKVKDTRSGYSSGYWRIQGEAVHISFIFMQFWQKSCLRSKKSWIRHWPPQCN